MSSIRTSTDAFFVALQSAAVTVTLVETRSPEWQLGVHVTRSGARRPRVAAVQHPGVVAVKKSRPACCRIWPRVRRMRRPGGVAGAIVPASSSVMTPFDIDSSIASL
jgi:hypothetical protein